MKLIIVLFIIIALGFINYENIFVSSQNKLSTIEYDCLVDLTKKINVLSEIPKNSYYDFCGNTPSFNVTCNNNSTTLIKMQSQSLQSVSAQDFSCFSKLKSLYLQNTIISNFFFTSPLWPSLIETIEIKTNSSTGIPFSKPLLQNIRALKFETDTQPLTTIPFSWYLGKNNFWFQLYPNIGTTPTSHLIYLENDLTGSQVWSLGLFDVISMNFPSFKNVNGYIYINLLPSFDRTSFENNITTIGNLSTIMITSKESNILFPGLFSTTVSTSLNSATFKMMFLPPETMIDLSILTSLSTLNFRSVGRAFSFNGNIPFILPYSLTTFEYSDGSVSILNFSDYNISKLVSLTLSNNSMSGSLPVWDTSLPLKNLVVHYNSLSGTIDRSYCSINLKVSNNNFNGLIPSCFTCFFGYDQSLKDSFTGNKFLNFNTTSPCTTIIPNIVLSRNVSGSFEFHIFGQDLGSTLVANNIKNVPSSFNINWVAVVSNSLFRGLYFANSLGNLPKTFELVYPSPLPSFTLSWDPLPPQISNVSWVGNQLVFSGSFFSYNSTIIDIDVGGYCKCNVSRTTFFQITCQVSNIPNEATDIITIVKVGHLSTQITLTQSTMNIPLNCSGELNDCNGNGYCNTRLSECMCYFRYKGIDCSLIECLYPLCGGNGECIEYSGTCDCAKSPHAYYGVNCTIPLHTVSSVDPSLTIGGNCSIYGWFGDIHENPKILIGSEDCPILSISQSAIICNAPPGEGLRSLTVSQNNIVVTTPKIYQYVALTKNCLVFNDCTSPDHGKCNTATGYCNCINNWYGPECNLLNGNNGGSENGGPPLSNITIDTDTASVNINNQQINYKISIISLLEIDFSGNVIFDYPLQNSWETFSNKSKTTTEGNTIFTFIQKIGTKNSSIIYTIEEVPINKLFSFAGIQFIVDGGSIKVTISIENYEFSRNLNTLQIQMKSSVFTVSNDNDDKGNCKDEDVEIRNIENGNSLNYISIKKDAKVLNGRFLDRVISDYRSTFMHTTLISKSNDSIIVGMNLPHCQYQCLIDPDFSVLVSPEFVSNCDGSSKKPWLIPVAIVVPVVVTFALSAAAVFIYRKNKIDPVILKLREMNKQNQQ